MNTPQQAEALKQAILEAHDALHKGDYKHAHDILHQALGIDGTELNLSNKPYYHDFDHAFRAAVRKHNVAAAYVVIDLTPRPGEAGNCRLLTGGHVDVCGVVHDMYKAYLAANGFRIDDQGKPQGLQS